MAVDKRNPTMYPCTQDCCEIKVLAGWVSWQARTVCKKGNAGDGDLPERVEEDGENSKEGIDEEEKKIVKSLVARVGPKDGRGAEEGDTRYSRVHCLQLGVLGHRKDDLEEPV